MRETVQIRVRARDQLHTAGRRIRIDALSHNQRHKLSVSNHSAGARGGPNKDGDQDRAKIELQAVADRSEDRGENTHSAEHQRLSADLHERQGEVQDVGECDRLEDQANGRHEGDPVERRNRTAADRHEKEMESTADLDELRGAVLAVRPEGALPEGVRIETELLRPRRDQVGALHRQERTLRDPVLGGGFFF